MQILTKFKPDRSGLNDARAKLRADPWQSILTLISSVVIVSVALYQSSTASGWAVCILITSAIATGVRVQYPVWALLAQSATTLIAASFTEEFATMSLGLTLICLISTGIERPLRIVIPAVVLVQITFFVMIEQINDDRRANDETLDNSIFGVICGTAGVAGLGVAIRSQRQYIEAINQRALHAEETREAESRRRVSEERMRIARDLHDAVAHHIAVVSVYTGLARTTLGSSVEKTEDALAKAQESTRSVLSELQQIVHILRDSENNPDGSRQPAPDFGSIDDLVASFRETGFRADYQVHGQAGTIPTSTGLVAFRVVQEALTNASKYGDGSASVDVTFGIDSLRIAVVNRISGSAHESLGTGHGLIGMRERVRLVDGTLTFTSDADTFTLVAVLPCTPQEVTPEVTRNGVVSG